ncbi:DUF2691 family protein [Paenibacillus sp. MZ03-122A]|uniref:DUF2691 family protein n=1 Tax=Paenibacillus sp. MZ03-122A TaxID=2962033 RepID=UPI0020B786BF|nr:DUF2691 family protein [Paenibacillus sp. MZ03-122A]MCP3779082.1 DUF2691 family protein [Paenibacillus sp. MZ03-122A]
MNRGISFEIPNSYGNHLGEILKPIDITIFSWFIGGEESYFIVDDTLGGSLFPDMVTGMDGEDLKKIIDYNKYYLIFANLKAYPKGANIIDVMSYEEYIASECQIILLVIDSVYITVYCKDLEKLEDLYDHIKRKGYKSLEYITDENDTRTRLSVW